MEKDPSEELIFSRTRELAATRAKILSLTPDKALEKIIEAPQAAGLVHSFPEQDLFLLIKDIGIEDALPVLALASNRQWEYILDADIWQRDRIDCQLLAGWLATLMKSDPGRLVKWVLEDKNDLVEFFLNKNIEVRIKEHDQDPADFGKDFFTLDSTFYIRLRTGGLIPAPTDDAKIESGPGRHDELIVALLRCLADENPTRYNEILLRSSLVIPAETEEEAYRLRNVRMAERGFLPFDEAIGVYQWLTPKDLEYASSGAAQFDGRFLDLKRAPLYPSGLMQDDNMFNRAVQTVNLDDQRDRLQAELAALVNQIAVADQVKVNSRAELKSIVAKAGGYLNIGLERLVRENRGAKIASSAAVLRRYELIQIFRVGYAAALALKRDARRWLEQSWCAEKGLSLSFWDTDGMGVLGGLLIKKPLYCTHEPSSIYREFSTSADIAQTRKALSAIEDFDRLLAALNPDVEYRPRKEILTYKNLVLTLWVREHLGLEAGLAPIPLADFKAFWATLWTAPSGKSRRIKPEMKTAFLGWLGHRSGVDIHHVSTRLGERLEMLFNEIEDEYRLVKEKELDSRYIRLFLIKN